MVQLVFFPQGAHYFLRAGILLIVVIVIVVIIIVVVVVIAIIVVIVVVVVVRWELPGFDCCCSGTLSSILICPHIWLQRPAMLSHIISYCHPYLIILSLLYVYPPFPPPLSP
jgi:hypothetical protein